jgi:two-component system, cell cycle sensor histidine kinase and response regulator CckA
MVGRKILPNGFNSDLAEILDDPVFSLDATFRLIDGNEAFFESIGLGQADVTGKGLREIFPENAARFLEQIARRSSVSTAPILKVPWEEYEGTGSDEPPPFASASAVRIRMYPQEDSLGILFLLHKPPKIDLDMPADRDSQIFPFVDDMNDIVYMTDSIGRITFANRQLLLKTGYSKEDFPNGFALNIVHEDDRKELVEIIREGRLGREGIKPELRVYHKDGRLLRFTVNYSPVKDSQGRFQGVIGFVQDVTRQHFLEQRLLRVRNLEMMRNLAEAIAGEFNNLLVGILGNISLLRVIVGKDLPYREHIERIEQAARRAEDLTQQLMACTRSGVGQPKPLDANAAIREIIDSLQGSLKEELLINFTPARQIGKIYADPAYIRQLLTNILQNSWEALPGGGRVDIRTETVVIGNKEISDLALGEYVRLCISDEGNGIEESDLGRVFEPFFTTKSMRRGLGLTAVHGIVTNLQGKIEIASRPGVGTTVTIHIPVMKPLSLPVLEERRGEQLPHILVVDDEEVVLEFCGAAFRSLGAEVTLVRNGEEAVEIFRRSPETYDLVLLDLVLPSQSGEETLRMLRAINRDTRIVVSSGHRTAQEALEKKGLMDRRSRFLSKPYDVQDLIKLLEEISPGFTSEI